MQLSNPRQYPVAGDHADGLTGAADTRNRTSIIAVFDERYTHNGNLVFAATRHLMKQFSDSMTFQVFCRGKYRGPRFGQSSKVRVVGTAVTPRPYGRRLRDMINRRLARLHLIDSADRWASNVDLADEALLEALFRADDTHAVVVYTSDPAYGVRVTRLVHTYSTSRIPHIVIVTPAFRIADPVVQELRRLGARILMDCDSATGSLNPQDPGAPPVLNTAIHPAARDLSAMLACFDFPRPLSFIDPELYPYQTAGTDAAVAWTDWIGTHLAYRPRVRDIILFIRPDWMNCGSGTTFESLARWFRESDALLIDIGIWPYAVPFDLEEAEEKVLEEQEHIGSALYFSTRRSNSVPYLLRQLGLFFRYLPTSITRQLLLFNAAAAKPALLRKAVAQAKITHIYLNHYFTYGFARELIADRKFFLDTHDVQSINFVHNGSRNLFTRHGDTFERLLNDEMEIAAKAERLSFVSTGELEMAAAFVPREKLIYLIALPSIVPCLPRVSAQPVRLLIVASNNAGNIRNLSWFMFQVWPLIQAQCKRDGTPSPEVVVCGGIASAFADDVAPNVTFLGVVDALWPYYNDCDVVLLPVVTGGGIAIKTIEALLHERPVIATRHALRGLPSDLVDLVGFADDPHMYARSVMRAIASEASLERQTQRSRQAAQVLRDQQFYRRLAEAMDAVRLKATP